MNLDFDSVSGTQNDQVKLQMVGEAKAKREQKNERLLHFLKSKMRLENVGTFADNAK